MSSTSALTSHVSTTKSSTDIQPRLQTKQSLTGEMDVYRHGAKQDNATSAQTVIKVASGDSF